MRAGERVKKCILWLALLGMSISSVHAQSYCVMDGNGEVVLEEKDMHTTQSVASISKIMTAIIAIEQGNMSDTWNVSDAITQVNGSSLYLQVGQEVSMNSLVYGLMLRSGNDAAVEIATHISGDVDTFVALMNEKARAIGMHDTTFHNPSGLDEEDGGNISSAYDMALLMSYAMKNPIFREITSSKYYTNESNIRWKNKNKLLFDYSQTTGGKTGFTKKAGRTLVSSASQDGMNSVVVTLDMGNDFEFHKDAHQEVFATHSPYTLLKAGDYTIQSYQMVIPKDIIIAIDNDRENTLQVDSFIKDAMYIINVSLNGETQTYTIPVVEKEKGGWFK